MVAAELTMAWLAGLRRRMWFTAAVSLVVSLAALSSSYRQRALALIARVAELQAEITSGQAEVTGRLRRLQGELLAALVGTVVLVVGMAAGGVLAVWRWLLVPFTALRRAADAVAA